jgi:hypothetical protein
MVVLNGALRGAVECQVMPVHSAAPEGRGCGGKKCARIDNEL